MNNLLVDLNNLGFITRFSMVKTPSGRRKKEKNVHLLIHKDMINYILHSMGHLGCDAVVVVRDSKNQWRRGIYSEYKANSTTDEDIYYSETIEAINMTFNFFKNYTSGMALEIDGCEADDIMYTWVENTNNKTTILSSDKDFVQLLSSKDDDRVRLYSPSQKEFRKSDDPDYELFVKCIRGDRSDNIRSAFPRVRETVLRKAWEDDLAMLNLLETKLPDGDKVSDKLLFNQALIDMSMIPKHIQDSIINSIKSYEFSEYSQMKAAKYMVDNNLEKFSKMFAFKDKFLKTKPIL